MGNTNKYDIYIFKFDNDFTIPNLITNYKNNLEYILSQNQALYVSNEPYIIKLSDLIKINSSDTNINTTKWEFNQIGIILKNENIFSSHKSISINNTSMDSRRNTISDQIYKLNINTEVNNVDLYVIDFFNDPQKLINKAIYKINITNNLSNNIILTMHIINDLYYYDVNMQVINNVLNINFNLNYNGGTVKTIFDNFEFEDYETQTLNNLLKYIQDKSYYILNFKHDNINKKYKIKINAEDVKNVNDLIYILEKDIINHLDLGDLNNILYDKIKKNIYDSKTKETTTSYINNFYWNNVKKIFGDAIITPTNALYGDTIYCGNYNVKFCHTPDYNPNDYNISNYKANSDKFKYRTKIYNLVKELDLYDRTIYNLNEYNTYKNDIKWHTNNCLELYKNYILPYLIENYNFDKNVELLFNKYYMNYEYIKPYKYMENYKIKYHLSLK